jgi:hypothetical protein
VPDQEFLFALDMSGEPPFDAMLAELARTVLGYVGYAASAVDALSSELRTALVERAANGQRRCEVRFVAHAGQLEIVVLASGRPDWRTTWPLPVSS